MLLALVVVQGCLFNFADPGPDDPRFLDRACEYGTCRTYGSAREASAITTDTIGFEMGPGAGSVSFELRPDGTDVTVMFLMAGHGVASVTSPEVALTGTFQLSEDYQWFDSTATTPSDAPSRVNVSVSVADDGSVVQLADIRAAGLDDLGGCAVSAPGRVRVVPRRTNKIYRGMGGRYSRYDAVWLGKPKPDLQPFSDKPWATKSAAAPGASGWFTTPR